MDTVVSPLGGEPPRTGARGFDVIVIGAGPAGMMAAIRAGERARKTLLLEQTDSPGKKLLISGKGRCNLTNSCDVKEFLDKFSASRDFLRNAFARFFNTDLISFFESAGLTLKTERGGRVFPTSDRANDVLTVLQSRLKDTGAAMLSGERVSEILVKDNEVAGVLTGSGKRFSADRVVIATGGLSYPETGSTGDGYGFAQQLGHKVVPPKPALSAVVIKETFIRDWQGISLRNVLLTLWSGDKRIEERFGEMLFTHFGVSGPAVLDISAAVYDALEMHHGATLSINLKPALDQKTLDARLLREFQTGSGKAVKTIFDAAENSSVPSERTPTPTLLREASSPTQNNTNAAALSCPSAPGPIRPPHRKASEPPGVWFLIRSGQRG